MENVYADLEQTTYIRTNGTVTAVRKASGGVNRFARQDTSQQGMGDSQPGQVSSRTQPVRYNRSGAGARQGIDTMPRAAREAALATSQFLKDIKNPVVPFDRS